MNLPEKMDAINQQYNQAEFEQILFSCIEDGELGFYHMQQLYRYNFDSWVRVKARLMCELTAMFWGIKGIDFLVEAGLNHENKWVKGEILIVLSHAATSLEHVVESFIHVPDNLLKRLDLTNEKYHSENFIRAAKDGLLNIVVNLEPEHIATSVVSHAIDGLAFKDSPYSKKALDLLLAAFSSRWLHITRKKLMDYLSLLQKPHVSEEEIHKHIASNPYLLDPFYAHIWSKEPLGEELIADFIVRLMDGSYIAVEIEKPTDLIMTRKGDMSAPTTHAIRQAIEYRSWLTDNRLYAQQRFENLRRPSCLVVIGMENSLSEKQQKLLTQRNEQGDVKIVGFDWLYQRAETILDNLIRHGLERLEFK